MRKINYWVVVVIFVLASFLIVRIETANSGVSYSARLDKFPVKIGSWRGEDIKVEDHVLDILGTKDVIIRRYKDKSGDTLILTVVYSDNNRDSFHPPEYCYIGGGAKLISKTKEAIPLEGGGNFITNKLVMKHSGGVIKAWYWYSAGDTFTDSYYLQQADFVWKAIKGRGLDGALIRVSIDRGGADMERKTKDFIREAIPFLKKTL
ncbi:MAG: EpsI family protein [Candidatus Omnitrophica bacterium 4484_171]|nr:MAG: EpsI family protein [Candidatus Omnitrophica bacterium 4484_171]